MNVADRDVPACAKVASAATALLLQGQGLGASLVLDA